MTTAKHTRPSTRHLRPVPSRKPTATVGPDLPHAPAEVQPAVSLDEVCSELVEEYGTLRLIYNTLARHHDTSIGEPVTEDMATDLGAVFNELGHAMERLDAISDRVGELQVVIGNALQEALS
jgi:hypothetical protein